MLFRLRCQYCFKPKETHPTSSLQSATVSGDAELRMAVRRPQAATTLKILFHSHCARSLACAFVCATTDNFPDRSSHARARARSLAGLSARARSTMPFVAPSRLSDRLHVDRRRCRRRCRRGRRCAPALARTLVALMPPRLLLLLRSSASASSSLLLLMDDSESGALRLCWTETTPAVAADAAAAAVTAAAATRKTIVSVRAVAPRSCARRARYALTLTPVLGGKRRLESSNGSKQKRGGIGADSARERTIRTGFSGQCATAATAAAAAATAAAAIAAATAATATAAATAATTTAAAAATAFGSPLARIHARALAMCRLRSLAQIDARRRLRLLTPRNISSPPSSSAPTLFAIAADVRSSHT